MQSEEKDKLLAQLSKIEMGLSKIYDHLSQREAFRKPVRAFWDTMKNEEIAHAYVFERIRGRLKRDKNFDIEMNVSLDNLKAFVNKVNQLLINIKNKSVSEMEAYNFGAVIEAEYDEASFLRKITTKDDSITKSISQLINETKKHNIVLVNHARGIR